MRSFGIQKLEVDTKVDTDFYAKVSGVATHDTTKQKPPRLLLTEGAFIVVLLFQWYHIPILLISALWEICLIHSPFIVLFCCVSHGFK